MKTPGERDKIRKSLNYSIADGACWSSMVGFGESFISAFAVFLKATNFQLAVLSSLPVTIGYLSQLFSDRVLRMAGSRKRIILFTAFTQGLMYLLFALAFFLGPLRVWHLIFFVTLYWIFAMISVPAWNSWMGDLVDPKEKGRYFGHRNKLIGFVYFAAYMAGGWLLQAFSTSHAMTYAGFALMFIIAFLSRIGSFSFLAKQYEPRYSADYGNKLGFLSFLAGASKSNFGRFALFMAFMNFGIYVCAAFFTPYMLQTHGYDYITFTLVNASMIVAKFLAAPLWGVLCDRYGSKKALTVTGFTMPMVPLFWALSGDPLYLVLVQIYSGFSWAGFELASFNLTFDMTNPRQRTRCIAFMNVLSGFSILAGGLVGSWLVQYGFLAFAGYTFTFAASCVIRYMASFAFIPSLLETRKVEHISYKHLMVKAFVTMPGESMAHAFNFPRGRRR